MAKTLLDKPYSEMSASEQYEAEEAAHQVLRAAYWDNVHTHADDVVRAIKDGEITDRDVLMEYVTESVDGCEYVIHTAKALQTLRYSDNGSAALEVFGTDLFAGCEDVPWSRLAFCALERDVYERLDAMGYGDDYFDREPDGEDDEEDPDGEE